MSTLFDKLPFAIRMLFLTAGLILAFYLDFGAALIACGVTGYLVIDILDHYEKQKGNL